MSVLSYVGGGFLVTDLDPEDGGDTIPQTVVHLPTK
jgi:hypothetical protein